MVKNSFIEKTYTHANKKKATQFTSFVENKYRHEHVMIINLYIVSHILYDCHLMNAFCEAFTHT